MTWRLEQRIGRLERSFHVGHDIDRAHAIVHAYHVVRDDPERASDEDRALAAATSTAEWQRAFATVIAAEGGLAAVVEASMKLRWIQPPR